MPTFELWCSDCIAKEHRKASPDVKAWSACDHCRTVTDLYYVVALDPLDFRVHTARIDLGQMSVLVIRRNGRKTTLHGEADVMRWYQTALKNAAATKTEGTVVTASFTGEVFEPKQE